MSALNYTDHARKEILDELEATLAMTANDRRKTLRRLANAAVENARRQAGYTAERWSELKDTVEHWPVIEAGPQPHIRSGSPSCFIEKCSLDVLYILVAALVCDDPARSMRLLFSNSPDSNDYSSATRDDLALNIMDRGFEPLSSTHETWGLPPYATDNGRTVPQLRTRFEGYVADELGRLHAKFPNVTAQEVEIIRAESRDPDFDALVDKGLSQQEAAKDGVEVVSGDPWLDHVLAEASAERDLSTPTQALFELPRENAKILDAVLGGMTNNKVTSKAIMDAINEGAQAKTLLHESDENLVKIGEQLKEARAEVARGSMISSMTIAASRPTAHGSLPGGSMQMVDAMSIWPEFSHAQGMMIPSFTWESAHPYDVAIDPDYVFREDETIVLLNALVHNEKTWIKGHTGTGKSSLVEQVAARLHWPVRKVSFDSDITRTELVGKVDLVQEEGTTISKFSDGLMPEAMEHDMILLVDEIDCGREDVTVVMQTVLNENQLVIAEDSGRVIHGSPFHRVCVTGNTNGQGDETGLYRATRQQNAALLDRFNTWIDVDYLEPEDEKQLLLRKQPGLTEKDADMLVSYASEHRRAFVNAEILQPISPRGLMALAKKMLTLPYKDDAKRLEVAVQATLLGRSGVNDYIVMSGISQRVFSVREPAPATGSAGHWPDAASF